MTPKWPLTPHLLRSHVWLYYHCVQVPWKYIKYVDTVTLFAKTWTKGHWPLDDLWPHICWGHMCDSTQGSLCPSPMGIHQCMWIQWSILQITTYILRTTYYIRTYYIQNEWSHRLFLNTVQVRQKSCVQFYSYLCGWWSWTFEEYSHSHIISVYVDATDNFRRTPKHTNLSFFLTTLWYNLLITKVSYFSQVTTALIRDDNFCWDDVTNVETFRSLPANIHIFIFLHNTFKFHVTFASFATNFIKVETSLHESVR